MQSQHCSEQTLGSSIDTLPLFFFRVVQVHVYDLSINKRDPLCEQKVVKRAHLTKVCFNQQGTACTRGAAGAVTTHTDAHVAHITAHPLPAPDPIILVGDDRGGVNSLKLSPNLRKLTPIPTMPAVAKGETPLTPPTRLEVEVGKMNKLLESADAPSMGDDTAAKADA